MHGLVRGIVCKPNINVAWSISELSYITGLSPPLKYFDWPFQGGTSFVDHLCYLYLVVCHDFASVHRCLVVTCWERVGLLALVCDVSLPFGGLHVCVIWILPPVWRPSCMYYMNTPSCLAAYMYVLYEYSLLFGGLHIYVIWILPSVWRPAYLCYMNTPSRLAACMYVLNEYSLPVGGLHICVISHPFGGLHVCVIWIQFKITNILKNI